MGDPRELSDSLWLGSMSGSVQLRPHGVAGVFLGKIGEDNFKARLKAINKLFKDVLIKVADHASSTYPKKLGNEQVQQLAELYVVKILTENGLIQYMDQSTAEKIVREVVDNCLGLRRPLKDMSAALDKV